MDATKFEIRPGAYYDSVVLMQLQKALAELPDVVDAGVVMATPANCELLTASGFSLREVEAKADDLLIMVKAESETAADDALAQVDTLLKQRRTRTTQDYRPRSLDAAAKALPDAGWVLVSVPGRYAAGVAEEALALGKHVFLYSDNVPLEEEIRLKRQAREKGLLLMGPDCGTAVINGVGLGFANRVRRGNVGLVAASGTGLQAVASEIHNLGGGVTQAIGTGGRDLKEAVGGMTTRQGLALLAADDDTECLVLISKPPATAVANRLLNAARALPKPVVVSFIGYTPPAPQLGNLYFAQSLSDAARLALSPERAHDAAPPIPRVMGYLRGLFSGGTLAYEATLTLQAFIAPLYSNVPVGAAETVADPLHSQAHTIIDMGEDIFTQGRLHPMLDNDLRLRRLREETAATDVGLILLDVVLGEGAHPNPAAELAPAIAAAKAKRNIEVAVLVVGTDDDPQNRPEQIAQLQAAGAHVFTDATACYAAVVAALAPETAVAAAPQPLAPNFAAINVGLESFYDSLRAQGAEAIHVDWRPPAGGNEKLMAILAKMKGQSG